MNLIKVLALMVTCLVIANIILFSFRKINSALFWTVLIVSAVIAYWVIPRLRNGSYNQNNQ